MKYRNLGFALKQSGKQGSEWVEINETRLAMCNY